MRPSHTVSLCVVRTHGTATNFYRDFQHFGESLVVMTLTMTSLTMR
jgi:hypothetical protein